MRPWRSGLSPYLFWICHSYMFLKRNILTPSGRNWSFTITHCHTYIEIHACLFGSRPQEPTQPDWNVSAIVFYWYSVASQNTEHGYQKTDSHYLNCHVPVNKRANFSILAALQPVFHLISLFMFVPTGCCLKSRFSQENNFSRFSKTQLW